MRTEPDSEIAASLSLPTELWTQIIRGLPAHCQRSCLSVSKLFHDISLQFVFASINIRLGCIRDLYLADEHRWYNWDELEQADADGTVARSCELLKQIARSSSGLASAVKNVSVRAYAFYGHNPPNALLDMLEEALSVLRLRGFAWYGCHPTPRPQVLQVLSAASRETMQDIVLPAEFIDNSSGFPFGFLTSLSFLNRYGDRYQLLLDGDDDDDNNEDDVCIAHMEQTIEAAPLSLSSLGIFGVVLGKCSVQRLTPLVELTLALLTDVSPLATVLTNCSSLRSLTILVGPDHAGDLAAVLREHASAVPHLTAFQLSCKALGRDMIDALAAFLHSKPLLERLDLGHHWDASRFENTEPLLRVISSLPRLRILGVEFSDSRRSGAAPRPDSLLQLSQQVPDRLTALSLWVTTPLTSTNVVTEAAWVQFFRGLRSCHFIYISTSPHYPGVDRLRRALFEHPPPSAELVGFHEDLRWVERHPVTGERAGYSASWPLSRVYNRTAEDFGCEEWEWLLRQVDLRLLGRRPAPCQFHS